MIEPMRANRLNILTIDGSHGEGGGQILRSSLALSMVTGTPFRIENIRAKRSKPGLMRQHLTAVNAAAKISGAKVTGAEIGSVHLTFEPGQVCAGDYTFSIGTAGSTTLVFQTILPALLSADRPSRLTFEGGTHNPFAPPFDFLDRAFLPLINLMGPRVSATLDRAGFYPAGGGRFTVSIQPAKQLAPLHILERGEIKQRSGVAMVASLSRSIAEREIKVLLKKTGWAEENFRITEVKESLGPGNIVFLEVVTATVTEVFTGFGEVRVSAEAVAERALGAYRKWLASEVPVGEYLADQILLPLAIAGSGSFRTMPLTRHSQTHIDLIRKFAPLQIQATESRTGVLVEITKR